MNTYSKPLRSCLPYLTGGILFFIAAVRFFTLGDMVGALISSIAGLSALTLLMRQS